MRWLHSATTSLLAWPPIQSDTRISTLILHINSDFTPAISRDLYQTFSILPSDWRKCAKNHCYIFYMYKYKNTHIAIYVYMYVYRWCNLIFIRRLSLYFVIVDRGRFTHNATALRFVILKICGGSYEHVTFKPLLNYPSCTMWTCLLICVIATYNSITAFACCLALYCGQVFLF